MKNKSFYVVNALTASRIVLALLMLFTAPLGAPFLVLLTLCGATDAADGFLARKTHSESCFGAKLDSAADAIFFMVTAAMLAPKVFTNFYAGLFVSLTALIKLMSMTVGLAKHKSFISLHTYLNKTAGLLCFLFPFLLKLFWLNAPCFAVFAVCLVAAAEEFILILRGVTDANAKSIFSKKKGLR